MPNADRQPAGTYVADWYFDFVSPFAYLQSEQLASLAPAVTVRFKPVLFAGILGAHGQKGPAEIPPKRAFTYRFVLWQAKRLGIPIKLPHEHPFNPLPLLRLAIACDCESVRDPPDLPFRLARRAPARPADRVGGADARPSPVGRRRAHRCPGGEGRRSVATRTRRSRCGVFGVPTLSLRGELFWGADATAMAADYAAAGCRWTDPEYARAAALPIGATRDAGKSAKRP